MRGTSIPQNATAATNRWSNGWRWWSALPSKTTATAAQTRRSCRRTDKECENRIESQAYAMLEANVTERDQIDACARARMPQNTELTTQPAVTDATSPSRLTRLPLARRQRNQGSRSRAQKKWHRRRPATADGRLRQHSALPCPCFQSCASDKPFLCMFKLEMRRKPFWVRCCAYWTAELALPSHDTGPDQIASRKRNVDRCADPQHCDSCARGRALE